MKLYKLSQLVKKYLKSSTFIYDLNARYQEWQLHKDFFCLQKHYNLDIVPNQQQLIEILQDKAKKRTIKNRPLRVIWVGASFEQDHSGFIQALEKVAEVITFTREDGTYGQEAPQYRKGLIYDRERRLNGLRLMSLYEQHGGAKEVDLVMGQMWSTLMDPEVLQAIRKKGSMVVNIAMDDKLPVHWQSDKKGRLAGAIGLGQSVDLTLNTFKQAIPMYAQHKAACIYWPLASNGDVFKPQNEKIYDVVFIGSNYGYRGKVIKKLQSAGINIAAFGPGFPSGMVSAQDSADIFGKAKIVLGMGFISYSRKLATLKLRDFDALFTGAMYITSCNPDLEEILHENEHVAYYDSTDELISKIKYYLANDQKRIEIAEQAMKIANEKHTWDVRIADTLELLGLIDER